jgi:acetyltransferase-like isoleucine patch superfamily enzyme
VTLKKNCKVGSHSVVMPGVTIGQNAVVGTFSFVNDDIPPDSVAVGIPARVVKGRSAPKDYSFPQSQLLGYFHVPL